MGETVFFVDESLLVWNVIIQCWKFIQLFIELYSWHWFWAVYFQFLYKMKDKLLLVITVNAYGENRWHCAALACLRSRFCGFPRSPEPSKVETMWNLFWWLLLELICCCDGASIIFLHNRSYLYLCPCWSLMQLLCKSSENITSITQCVL